MLLTSTTNQFYRKATASLCRNPQRLVVINNCGPSHGVYSSRQTGVARFSTENSGPAKSSSSSSSSSSSLVTTDLFPETKIATITMHRKPANSLSLEMMVALSEAIRTAEANDRVEALILSSGLPNGIFSAGLELTELYNPDSERLPMFWYAFQQLYLDLYGSRLSTIAAMDGHAPAAGCMLAISCDYRIMTSNPKATIGLNESQLGIVAPPWLCQQYIDTVGQRNAELALLLGTLFSPQRALELHLVDELLPTSSGSENDDKSLPVTALDAAMKKAAAFVRIPSKARVAAKELTRGVQIQKLLKNRDADTEFFCSFVTQDSVQRTLGAYLEMLSKRKKE
jgi:3,2-trans-enoyl-CoA isomerase